MEQSRKVPGTPTPDEPIEISGEALPAGANVPLDPQIEATLSELLSVQAQLDARKALYERLNSLTLELVRLGFVRCVRGAEVIELKDNFAHGNTAWTAAPVRRFEVEVISAALAEKRAKRGVR